MIAKFYINHSRMHVKCRSELLTSVGINGPLFSVIEVGVSAVNWEVSVSKCAASAVKWIAISMLALLEPDLDVYFASGGRLECQCANVLPHLKCMELYSVSVLTSSDT